MREHHDESRREGTGNYSSVIEREKEERESQGQTGLGMVTTDQLPVLLREGRGCRQAQVGGEIQE